MLWTIVLWTKLDKYNKFFLNLFDISAISLYSGWLLGHYLVNSLSHLMLIIVYWKYYNKVSFLSQIECLMWFELRTFWFNQSILTQ